MKSLKVEVCGRDREDLWGRLDGNLGEGVMEFSNLNNRKVLLMLIMKYFLFRLRLS